MKLNKKNLVIIGIAGGILLFFLGLGLNFLLGPTTNTYQLPRQISTMVRLSGMGIICISMIIGGFFIEKIEKDTKSLILIFGLILLLINIMLFTFSDTI
jgi:uncharacterized membrane protein AbrB (regulator of aidB expression)